MVTLPILSPDLKLHCLRKVVKSKTSRRNSITVDRFGQVAISLAGRSVAVAAVLRSADFPAVPKFALNFRTFGQGALCSCAYS